MAGAFIVLPKPDAIPGSSVGCVVAGARHHRCQLPCAGVSRDRVPVKRQSGSIVINIFAYGSLLCDATLDAEHVEVVHRAVAVLPGFKRVWGPAVRRNGQAHNPHAIVRTGAEDDVVTGALIRVTKESLPYFEYRERAYHFSNQEVIVDESLHRVVTFESRAPVAYDVPVYASYAATVACGLIELLGAENGEREFRRSMIEHYRLIDDVSSGPNNYTRWSMLDADQQALGLNLLQRVTED